MPEPEVSLPGPVAGPEIGGVLLVRSHPPHERQSDGLAAPVGVRFAVGELVAVADRRAVISWRAHGVANSVDDGHEGSWNLSIDGRMRAGRYRFRASQPPRATAEQSALLGRHRWVTTDGRCPDQGKTSCYQRRPRNSIGSSFTGPGTWAVIRTGRSAAVSSHHPPVAHAAVRERACEQTSSVAFTRRGWRAPGSGSAW
jgi:hypothetical protein